MAARVRQADAQQEKILQARRAKHKADATQIAVGDTVFLRHEHRPPSSVAPALHGPFRVMERVVGEKGVFRVEREHLADLNPSNKWKKVHEHEIVPFDASRCDQALLSRVSSQDDKLYIIEKIIDHRNIVVASTRAHTCHFLIRWLGFDESFDSWIPVQNIRVSECVALRAYLLEKKLGFSKEGSVSGAAP